MSTLDLHRSELAALYTTHQPRLGRQLRALVNTTPENLEDACMFAWTQLLTRQLRQPETVGTWLLTVARREAIKLDQRARRTDALPAFEGEPALEPVDPRDEIGACELSHDAAAIIAAARLTDREARFVGLQAVGLTYEEIASLTANTLRTVERQLLRAHGKLRHARDRCGR